MAFLKLKSSLVTNFLNCPEGFFKVSVIDKFLPVSGNAICGNDFPNSELLFRGGSNSMVVRTCNHKNWESIWVSKWFSESHFLPTEFRRKVICKQVIRPHNFQRYAHQLFFLFWRFQTVCHDFFVNEIHNKEIETEINFIDASNGPPLKALKKIQTFQKF